MAESTGRGARSGRERMWVWREVKRLESVVAGGGGVNEVEGAGRGSRKVAVRSSVICREHKSWLT